MFGDKIKKRLVFTICTGGAIAILWYCFCLPRDLFKGTNWSTVVLDRNGEMLGARIASDGQWRFPPCDSLPEKYVDALIEFEDKWFRWHPGVNPVSIVRSAIANGKAGHVVCGGSTLTMQVIRMSRGRKRTISQKIIEAVLATGLELRCSKDEILELYAAHAPFGGNVVGIEAAAWRYFGRPSNELTWAEAATLAILPNSPSSIRPGKNREKLLGKRNRLLAKLFEKGKMSRSDYELACVEPLPSEPSALPSYAPHLVDLLSFDGRKHSGESIRTTLDIHLQRRVEEIVNRHSDNLAKEGINDLAAVVVDVRTGEVLAYCGNSSPYRKRSGVNVDVARSPRSSGSILKPLLYCASMQDGVILPYSLVADTPVNINGFAPQNYDLTYDGAVPAAEAVSRSLNVPSVHILKKYGVAAFKETLEECGLTTLTRSADDYGLSLILGGAECRLDEIVPAYAAMSRRYVYGEDEIMPDFPLNDKMALWYTFEAMSEVNRPDEIDWHLISSVRKIAWKTGTSYGYRDGWACGADPGYAVGVWAGNASGVAAPGLIGARTAGPVLFDIFNMLPGKYPDTILNSTSLSRISSSGWFAEPVSGDGTRVEVCRLSGYLAGPYCSDIDTLIIPCAGLKSTTCPYHHYIDGRDVFRLTPAMEWYYRLKHPDYPYDKGGDDTCLSRSAGSGAMLSAFVYGGAEQSCTADLPAGLSPMEFIYPENGSVISLPRQLDGTPGEMVFNLAHHDRSASVYWHLDQQYLGETRFIHQFRLRPNVGSHTLTVVDLSGSALSINFTVK